MNATENPKNPNDPEPPPEPKPVTETGPVSENAAETQPEPEPDSKLVNTAESEFKKPSGLGRLNSVFEIDQESIWDADNPRPISNIPLRMIENRPSDITQMFSTDKKLAEHTTCPPAPQQFIMDYNKDMAIEARRKSRNRTLLCGSITICIILLLIELTFLILGIVMKEQCGYTNLYLMVSALFHSMIIIIEWLHLWMGQVNNHIRSRGFVDFFLVSTSFLLFLLYMFSIIWFSVGFAWFMAPYTESFSNKLQVYRYIVVYEKESKVIEKRSCSKTLIYMVMGYQIFTMILVLFRIIALGFSSFCRGFIHHLTQSNKEGGSLLTPYVAENSLSDKLPPVYSTRYLQVRPLGHIHSNANCMIYNHPKWKYKESVV